MRCPACGSPATKQQVHKTIDAVDENKRWRRCLCGARWATVEKLIKGTLQVICDPVIATRQVTCDPPVTEGQVISDPSVSLRGRGVGSSPGIFPISSFGSGSLEANRSEVLSKSSTGMDKVPYPGEFETIWAHTGRNGAKFPAFKAWKKFGKPSAEIVNAKWDEYMRSDKPSRGFVKDLSTWLNARGWEQSWAPAKNVVPSANGTRPAASQQRIAVGMEWLASKQTGGVK